MKYDETLDKAYDNIIKYITDKLNISAKEQTLLVIFTNASAHYGTVEYITHEILRYICEQLTEYYEKYDFPYSFSEYLLGHVEFMLDDNDFDVKTSDYFNLYIEDQNGNFILYNH